MTAARRLFALRGPTMVRSGRPCLAALSLVTPHVLLVALASVLAVCGGHENVARGKPTAHINTYHLNNESRSSKAVDGLGNFSAYGCTHTDATNNTWWIVDFLRDYLVHEANITNRPPGFNPQRLQKFTVQVSQENPLKHPGFPTSLPGHRCFYRDAQISATTSETIPCTSPIIGRYLTVFKTANEHLAICELVALATNVSQQQFQFQAVQNKRKQADPFFTHSRARSGLECVSLCSRPLNGTATVVQYRGSDGLCECLQVSSLDDPQPLEVDSQGWVMYVSKSN